MPITADCPSRTVSPKHHTQSAYSGKVDLMPTIMYRVVENACAYCASTQYQKHDSRTTIRNPEPASQLMQSPEKAWGYIIVHMPMPTSRHSRATHNLQPPQYHKPPSGRVRLYLRTFAWYESTYRSHHLGHNDEKP